MEKQNQMFRLKLAYQAENKTTGEVEKVKEEILAECANYTDAETLLNKIIETFSMNKLEPVVYEIIKCKFSGNDIYLNSLIDCDSEDTPLTCGRLNCFFKDSTHGLYSVDTIIFGDKELKEKDIKRTFLIPASNTADASIRAEMILTHDGNNEEDIAVINVKYDKAGSFYFEPMSFESLNDRSYKIFQ